MSFFKNKNNKKIIVFISLILVFCLAIFFVPNVLADAGNNNRYDFDIDSGSSSSGSSSGDFFFIDLIFELLFEVFGPIPGIILSIIVIIIYFKLKNNGKFNTVDRSNNSNISHVYSSNMHNRNDVSSIVDNTKAVSEEIRKIDPFFSEEKFLGFARECFLKVQQAWSDRKFDVIRPFESNELFQQHSNQLNEYIRGNKINVVEKIAINRCVLNSFYVDGDKEVLVVELNAVMRDYVIDATTKEVLEGDPKYDWYMNYVLTFNRTAGVKTVQGKNEISTTNCPNCGAPTSITSSGKCEYCNSVITTGEYGWVLNELRKK